MNNLTVTKSTATLDAHVSISSDGNLTPQSSLGQGMAPFIGCALNKPKAEQRFREN